MPKIKDQAICIRHLDWSETSQIVSLFTREHGVIRGLAKGSKRQSPSSTQRFSGGIALLSMGEVVASWKNRSLMAVSSENTVQYYGMGFNQAIPRPEKELASPATCHVCCGSNRATRGGSCTAS